MSDVRIAEPVVSDILERLGGLQQGQVNTMTLINKHQAQTFALTAKLTETQERQAATIAVHAAAIAEIKSRHVQCDRDRRRQYVFSGVLAGLGLILGWFMSHIGPLLQAKAH